MFWAAKVYRPNSHRSFVNARGYLSYSINNCYLHRRGRSGVSCGIFCMAIVIIFSFCLKLSYKIFFLPKAIKISVLYFYVCLKI